jgi:transposase-like protein
MSERKKLKMISSTIATSAVPAVPIAALDPEVREVAKRRQFTAAYKLSVLEEADRCASPGAIGALLRREGLYSSHLSMWRRERDAGALVALARRRGRKVTLTAEQRRIAELHSRCARLERELEQGHTIVEVQK